MRTQSYKEMQIEYQPAGVAADDIKEREKLLSKYNYSIIVELSYLEFDTLEKWMKLNISEDPVEQVWYGKTGYDFGFVEFFVHEEEQYHKMAQHIPNIYTIYPDAYPTEKISRSFGYNEEIEYSPTDKDAIIFKY
jgi:hypothetical protein